MGNIIPFIWGRLLGAKPRIRKLGKIIIAETSIMFALITLGLKLRKIKISPEYGKIQIDDRYFWIFTKSQTVAFRDVKNVVYHYADINPLGGFPGTALQEWDQFAVSLRLHRGADVPLCKFFGSGGLQNNTVWPDWCYWDQELMCNLATGSQEDESRIFVETLISLIHVDLVNQ